MNRGNNLNVISTVKLWDVIIIGGGATGLGAAVDAANRGYKTLLLEQSDFAKGTSSRSTKLVHGGVRYLAQGNIRLVYDALRERGYLHRNASHVVEKQQFVIPCYTWFSVVKYYVGLTLYDWLSGKLSFGRSVYYSRKRLLQLIPGVKAQGLKGGIEYTDGQFDDARLAVQLAQTSEARGGVLLNYMQVTALIKGPDGKADGVVAVDVESGTEYCLHGKVIINATGVFADGIMKMDAPLAASMIVPSQGVHIVLPASFLNSGRSVMIPETTDGRVLFVVPWHGHLLVGTTDTPVKNSNLEPRALESEISFILGASRQYLNRAPGRNDVLSVFAGLRPLAAQGSAGGSTKEISRKHQLKVSRSGLVTVIGGKWTTYRKMAEDVIDEAIRVGRLPAVKCTTRTLKIHGHTVKRSGHYLGIYGTDEENIRALIAEAPEWGQQLAGHMPYTHAEVIWAVRHEMARTVEDVLARRLRILFLDARAAIGIAPQVAAIMAKELRYSRQWEDLQVRSFAQLAGGYLLAPL